MDRRIRRALRRRGGECGICRGALGPIDYEAGQYEPLAFEVDHIIPISRGGLKILTNSRASHRTCNRKRSNTIDADAVAAGAEMPADEPSTAGRVTRASSRRPAGWCELCSGVHVPPGSAQHVTFVTSRVWQP